MTTILPKKPEWFCFVHRDVQQEKRDRLLRNESLEAVFLVSVKGGTAIAGSLSCSSYFARRFDALTEETVQVVQ
jgi:hypothetical protein